MKLENNYKINNSIVIVIIVIFIFQIKSLKSQKTHDVYNKLNENSITSSGVFKIIYDSISSSKINLNKVAFINNKANNLILIFTWDGGCPPCEVLKSKLKKLKEIDSIPYKFEIYYIKLNKKYSLINFNGTLSNVRPQIFIKVDIMLKKKVEQRLSILSRNTLLTYKPFYQISSDEFWTIIYDNF